MKNKKIEVKSSSTTQIVPRKGTPAPVDKTAGVIHFQVHEIAETLQELNQIFDKHHRKYNDRLLWRKAIIENLAAWKLGIK